MSKRLHDEASHAAVMKPQETAGGYSRSAMCSSSGADWCLRLPRNECEPHFARHRIGDTPSLSRTTNCIWSATDGCRARQPCPVLAPETQVSRSSRHYGESGRSSHAPLLRCCKWVATTKRVPHHARCGMPDSPPPLNWRIGVDRPPNQTRFLRIVANHGSAGFFAYMLFVVNQLLFADKYGLTPMIQLGKCTVNGHDHYASGAANLYYDSEHGPNVWEYFFEPVASIIQGTAPEAEVLTLPSKALWWLHHRSKSSVYAHYYGRRASHLHRDLLQLLRSV